MKNLILVLAFTLVSVAGFTASADESLRSSLYTSMQPDEEFQPTSANDQWCHSSLYCPNLGRQIWVYCPNSIQCERSSQHVYCSNLNGEWQYEDCSGASTGSN